MFRADGRIYTVTRAERLRAQKGNDSIDAFCIRELAVLPDSKEFCITRLDVERFGLVAAVKQHQELKAEIEKLRAENESLRSRQD